MVLISYITILLPLLQSTTAASRGAPSEDLFKSDPFGSSSAASKAEAPPTSSAGSTDPFSGQDPFSSDPFSGNERKDEDQVCAL